MKYAGANQNQHSLVMEKDHNVVETMEEDFQNGGSDGSVNPTFYGFLEG